MAAAARGYNWLIELVTHCNAEGGRLLLLIIIINNVLTKVTLSCQRHCRGTVRLWLTPVMYSTTVT